MALEMQVQTGALDSVLQGHQAVIALLQQEIALTRQLQQAQRTTGQRVVVSGQQITTTADSRGAAPAPIIGATASKGTASVVAPTLNTVPDARGKTRVPPPIITPDVTAAQTQNVWGMLRERVERQKDEQRREERRRRRMLGGVARERGGAMLGAALAEARVPGVMQRGGPVVPAFAGEGGGRAAIRIRRRARAIAMAAEFPELQQQLDREIARGRGRAQASQAALATIANNSAAISNAIARGDFAAAAASTGVLLRESQTLQRRFGVRVGQVGAGLFGIGRGFQAAEQVGQGLKETGSLLSDLAIVTATGAAVGGGIPGAVVAAAAFTIGVAGGRVKRAITGEDRNIAAQSRKELIAFFRANSLRRNLKAADLEEALEKNRQEELRKALEGGSISWIDYKLTSNEKLDAEFTKKLGKAAKDMLDTMDRSYDAARLGNLEGAQKIERGFFTRNENEVIRDEFNNLRVPIGSAGERWYRWQNALIENRNWAALESKRGRERSID